MAGRHDLIRLIVLSAVTLPRGHASFSERFSWASKDPESQQSQQSSLHMSVSLKSSRKDSQKLPGWCKDSREHGAFHVLSDDEYTDESPYQACAMPRGQGQRRRLPKNLDPLKANCSKVLSIPKVALLFFTRGELPHEELWSKWLGSIEGQIPKLCAANAVCSRGGYKVLQNISAACSTVNSTGNAYNKQFLYSIYVHIPPNAKAFGPNSIFHGRDTIVPKFATTWGDHSTVEVLRSMMATALKDQNNQRFLTLSESCVPMYSALVIYQQLMHETRSRISACSEEFGRMKMIWNERYNPRMTRTDEDHGARIELSQWRTHTQWISLIRSHAEVVKNDTEVITTFVKDCFLGPDPLKDPPYRNCLGDESYVGTLLALRGLEAQTDCLGRLTSALWDISFSDSHPRPYQPDDIRPDLFREIREGPDEAEAAISLASQGFSSAADLGTSDDAWYMPYPNIRKLRSSFHIFARKFPPNTAAPLLQMLLENDVEGSVLRIFNGVYKD